MVEMRWKQIPIGEPPTTKYDHTVIFRGTDSLGYILQYRQDGMSWYDVPKETHLTENYYIG